MFSHILLYLIICSLSLCRCYIHIIKFNRDINVIIRLLFQLGQKNNSLHMHRMSELVYRLNTSYLVTVSSKIFQVACKCCRITAHVHNPLRIHFDNRIKKCLIAALSRRVNNHNIRINPHYRLKGGRIGQSRTFF